ncbi:P-loop containing nucleoside triphosphate hydrolase protein [Mycena pura]|uniref:P-loop containing nucleoside triphosphate hydrolase protein n=1 Tax=Mycena pura TaxID=153505 RepID=A0AAD6V5J0_9AGAR|nr:P-loop containing nucleoside triphosphate hydrolase protein [Mycena pura]
MGTFLGIKHIDKIREPDSGEWIIQNQDRHESATKDKYAEWAEYAFLVQRTVVQTRSSDYPEMSTTFLIRSDLLRRSLRGVMGDGPGINWTGSVVELDPQLLLSFLPRITEAASNLSDTPGSSEGEESTTKEHLSFLVKFLESEYATLLKEARNLLQQGEITFDLLWAVFVPGEVIFAPCETTGEPRAFRLWNTRKRSDWNSTWWNLTCEYVEAMDNASVKEQQFGLAYHNITIKEFDGVRKIAELAAYPFKYHADADIRQKLTHRGRKWMELVGVHHKQYSGLAYRHTPDRRSECQWVNGRIMIDRRTFASAEPEHRRSTPRKGFLGKFWVPLMDEESESSETQFHPSSVSIQEMKDDDLLLTTPIVYGFSLMAKRWFELNVECVTNIEWNDEAFDNLTIDPDRKILIRGLVESHTSLKGDRSVDDFVIGKGLGLIFNLFGPPGVGKTLTVEATAEHLRKPLYVMTAGELGTTPPHLDSTLTKIFSLVPVWDAVVLIDEADVFLEERSTADLGRNAMVAVFLRQLEYSQGILFLTSNRVKRFDPAFHSRIHLSLHYSDLLKAEKEQLWRAFLEKTRTTGLGLCDLSKEELQMLSRRELNGRQIKNTVKLSLALAAEEGKALTYAHLVRALSVADSWGSKQETSYQTYLIGLPKLGMAWAWAWHALGYT